MTRRFKETDIDIALFFNAVVECTIMRAYIATAGQSAEMKLRYETTRIAGEEALRRLICPFEPDPPKGVAKKRQIT
jgi:hypothetical protein